MYEGFSANVINIRSATFLGILESLPRVKVEKTRNRIMDVLNIQWKYSNKKRLTKLVLIKKITASEIRDLFYVRCTVFFRKSWIIFSFVLDSLN